MRLVKPDAEVYDIGLNIGDCYRVKDTIEISDAGLDEIGLAWHKFNSERGHEEFKQLSQYLHQLLILAGEGK
jgi:hypothetical protein